MAALLTDYTDYNKEEREPEVTGEWIVVNMVAGVTGTRVYEERVTSGAWDYVGMDRATALLCVAANSSAAGGLTARPRHIGGGVYTVEVIKYFVETRASDLV